MYKNPAASIYLDEQDFLKLQGEWRMKTGAVKRVFGDYFRQEYLGYNRLQRVVQSSQAIESAQKIYETLLSYYSSQGESDILKE